MYCHSEGNRKRAKQSYTPVDEVRISEVTSPQIVGMKEYSCGTSNRPIDFSKHCHTHTNPYPLIPVAIDHKKNSERYLVMTNAGRIEHPYFLSGVIAEPYIIFGQVQSVHFMNWNAMTKQTKDWKRNSYSEERICVEWMTFEVDCG